MNPIAKYAIAVVVGAAVGSGSVWKLRPAKVETRTEYKDRVVTQTEVKVVTVEKPVIRWKERVVVQYRSDGSVATRSEEKSGSDTGEVTTTRETEKSHESVAVVKGSTVTTDAPRLHLFLEAAPFLNLGPGPTVGVNAMLGGVYDFARIGPLNVYTGVEVLLPVLPSIYNPTFIVPLGISVSR